LAYASVGEGNKLTTVHGWGKFDDHEGIILLNGVILRIRPNREGGKTADNKQKAATQKIKRKVGRCKSADKGKPLIRVVSLVLGSRGGES